MNLIDVDVLLAEIEEEIEYEKSYDDYDRGITAGLRIAYKDIKKQPKVEAEPIKYGRWVCVDAEPEKVWCDNCKTTYRSSDLLNIGADDEKVNFCPNCGARMDGDEE